VRGRGHVEPVFVARVEDLAEPLGDLLRPGDVVLAMGAGHISGVAHDLPAQLAALTTATGRYPFIDRRRK
jgi:UDP-N-acetylmuramate--alanine ligase